VIDLMTSQLPAPVVRRTGWRRAIVRTMPGVARQSRGLRSRVARSGLPPELLSPALLREIRAARRQNVLHMPRPPAGLVLEIGAGQAPNPETDVVVDKYVVDDFERPGEQALSFDRPLVVADGEQLPFADRSFDYVIALHVLEHAVRPDAFAAQMSRVGAAGFVQVPSRESELTFGWDYHPWLIDLEGETLAFTPRGDAVAPVGGLFHRAFAESPLMRLWWSANRSTWHHSLAWSGELAVRVRGESEALQTAGFDLERTVAALRQAGDEGRTAPLTAAVRAALRCPACGDVLVGEGELSCRDCGRAYPVVGHVPILLDSSAE